MARFFQTLEIIVLFFPMIGKSWAADPILGSNELTHLHAALQCLNMSERDLGFDKDLGKPLWALKRIRTLLADPLELPKLGDRISAVAQSAKLESIWLLAVDLLECPPASALPSPTNIPTIHIPPLDPVLVSALEDFFHEAGQSDAWLANAFASLSRDDMNYLAASFFASTFNAEDRPDIRQDILESGVSAPAVEQVLTEGRALDPEPAATNFLALVHKIDLSMILAAGRNFQEACEKLRWESAEVTAWPDKIVSMETPWGAVAIGTPYSDTYTNSFLLIMDPAGDDLYSGAPAAADGLTRNRLAAVVDLAGNDQYVSDHMLGPGSALFGVSVLLDASHNDIYWMKYTGEGSAIFGAAWFEDISGDDVYRAYGHAQGAAFVGAGILQDDYGTDIYDIGLTGQAFAGMMGFGFLVDRIGNDRYYAGGRETDSDRHGDRFTSLGQGFSIGWRPFAGGGFAALVDLEGNDNYTADIFGQGASYWYSCGMLLDLAGNDSYQVYQYGQGAGIHLSLGLLADTSGDDVYTGHILTQGAGHDYGVGMLADRVGDDTYSAAQHSQGRAMNNSLALLVDSAGADDYFAREPDACQGIGNDGDMREYGSLAILMDLEGKDSYSCGATNGCRLLRPDFGIVYDYKPPTNTAPDSAK